MSSSVSLLTLVAISGLHGPARKIVELPHEVARRASSEAGNRSQSAQFGPMADRAWRALSAAAGGSELSALFDAPRRHVGDEVRSRVAHLEALQILRNLDDATRDRLHLAAR